MWGWMGVTRLWCPSSSILPVPLGPLMAATRPPAPAEHLPISLSSP